MYISLAGYEIEIYEVYSVIEGMYQSPVKVLSYF